MMKRWRFVSFSVFTFFIIACLCALFRFEQMPVPSVFSCFSSFRRRRRHQFSFFSFSSLNKYISSLHLWSSATEKFWNIFFPRFVLLFCHVQVTWELAIFLPFARCIRKSNRSTEQSWNKYAFSVLHLSLSLPDMLSYIEIEKCFAALVCVCESCTMLAVVHSVRTTIGSWNKLNVFSYVSMTNKSFSYYRSYWDAHRFVLVSFDCVFATLKILMSRTLLRLRSYVTNVTNTMSSYEMTMMMMDVIWQCAWSRFDMQWICHQPWKNDREAAEWKLCGNWTEKKLPKCRGRRRS